LSPELWLYLVHPAMVYSTPSIMHLPVIDGCLSSVFLELRNKAPLLSLCWNGMFDLQGLGVEGPSLEVQTGRLLGIKDEWS
jgi:hypothetical protein